MRRLLVCGGRDFQDAELLFYILDRGHQACAFSVVIHGAARGADTLAAEWARDRKVPEEPYPAQWARYGKKAGTIRNAYMLALSSPDQVFAFSPSGPGTADMVRRAEEQGIPVGWFR